MLIFPTSPPFLIFFNWMGSRIYILPSYRKFLLSSKGLIFQIHYFLIFIFLYSLLLIVSQITLLCSYIILGLKTFSAFEPDSALSFSASTTGNIPMSTVNTTEGMRESLSFTWNRLLCTPSMLF